MERDAHSPSPPPSEVLPPVPWETARRVGLVGAGLTAAAAALGLAATALDLPSPVPPAGEPKTSAVVTAGVISTARLFLVLAGSVTAGFAVSLRPDRWQAWAVGAAAALLGVFGVPAHWDSFRFLFWVLAAVAVFRLVLVVVPPAWRVRAVSAFILFHFGGIFMATTSPPPTPWFVEQTYHRLYNQYLQFAYLRNAYHFYSPEPGPASILACLVKTEVGEEVTATGERRKKYETRWVVLPKRPEDIRDPLGLTYYRRLSLTEQVSRGVPDLMLPEMFEKHEVHRRRVQRAQPGNNPTIPLHPSESDALEYKLPSPEITRFLLPSYAQHLILEHTPDADAAARTTVKIYRIEHRTLGVGEFVGFANYDNRPGDPYHPTTYRPYFLGEFNAHGKLVNPQEDMLYWLVPIVPRPGGAAPADPVGKDYEDYMSVHAGHEFDWSQLR